MNTIRAFIRTTYCLAKKPSWALAFKVEKPEAAYSAVYADITAKDELFDIPNPPRMQDTFVINASGSICPLGDDKLTNRELLEMSLVKPVRIVPVLTRSSNETKDISVPDYLVVFEIIKYIDEKKALAGGYTIEEIKKEASKDNKELFIYLYNKYPYDSTKSRQTLYIFNSLFG